MIKPEELAIDPVKTKAALAEVAATFATLAEEKFMTEYENIKALPEDKQKTAEVFYNKQKNRINQHVEVVKNHLQHYVDLIMLGDIANTAPLPTDMNEAVKVISVIRILASKVMQPVIHNREQAAQNFNNGDNSQVTKH